MLALTLLGGLALARDDAPLPPSATQRRRLTLLALLALAGPRGAGRERVQAALWPDSPPERARHALEQLLYATRRDLGRDAVLSAGDQLRLNGDAVRVDLWAFQEAVRCGDARRAAALHAGPLLDGVTLAAEAEREAEGVRAAVRADHRRALERLGTDAAACGAHAESAEWWARAAAAEPLDARVALALMRALADAGDRAGAVRHAAVHARLLREELDAEPDAAVAALAERLAAGEGASTPGPATIAPAAIEPAAIEPAAITPAVAEPAPPPSWPPPPSLPERRVRARRFALAAATVLVVVAAGLVASRAAARAPDDGAHLVAVLPFGARGGPDAASLAEGMPMLLGTNLDGVGDLRGVDPRALLAHVARARDEARAPDPALGAATAAHFGAGQFVLGDVVQVGDRLRMSGALYARRDGRVLAEAAVEGRTAEFFTLVDRLTADLLVRRERGPRGRLARLASATTASFPALKAYLAGEGAMRAGRYLDAEADFARAVAADSGFALAYYRLAMVASWTDAREPLVTYADLALRHAERLGERERQLLAAVRAEQEGDAAAAERGYRAIVGQHPDDVETWLRLGEILFHGGPLRGAPPELAHEPFARVLALDPEHPEALLHLARLAALGGRQARFDSLVARYHAVDAASAQAWEIGVVADFRRGADAEARRLAELASASDARLYSAVRNVAVYGRDPAGAARVARLMTAPQRAAETRAYGHALAAVLHAAGGRHAEARAALARAAGESPRTAFEVGALLDAAPDAPGGAVDLARWTIDVVEAPDPPHPSTAMAVHDGVHAVARAYALALRAARAGDSAAVERHVSALTREPAASPVPSLRRDLAASARAHLAARLGRPAEALAILEGAPVRAPMQLSNFSPLYNRAHDRFLRARLLERLGRGGEARGWYAALGGDSFFELPYVAAARARLAALGPP